MSIVAMLGAPRRWGLSVLLLCFASRAGAQGSAADTTRRQLGAHEQQPRAAVHVRVTDSTRAPVSDANVVLVKDDSIVLLRARTDSSGRYNFSFPVDTARYKLLIRRVGYSAAERTLHPQPGDTLSLSFVLARISNALDTVRIAESRLPQEQQPVLGASEIAAAEHDRTILSLGDAIIKLRGRMDFHRSTMCHPAHRDYNVFIPGPLARPRIPRGLQLPWSAVVYVNGAEFPWYRDPWFSIQGDAIASIQFVQCFDQSTPGVPANPWSSLYVTLKPGYDWDVDRGAFKIGAADTSKRL